MKILGFNVNFWLLILCSVFFVGLHCKTVKRSVIDIDGCGVPNHIIDVGRIHNPDAKTSMVKNGEFPW